MSIPFPQPDVPQPFLPIGTPVGGQNASLGVPFPQSYYPPSPVPSTPQEHHYRPRTHSHSSNHGHHHHHRHSHSHHRSSSRDHHHSHTHGRSHSHSRNRHHSAPAPPILIQQSSVPGQYVAVTPSHTPQPYQQQAYQQQQAYPQQQAYQQQAYPQQQAYQQGYQQQAYQQPPPYQAQPQQYGPVQIQYGQYSGSNLPTQAPPSPYLPQSRALHLHAQQHSHPPLQVGNDGRSRMHSFMHPLFRSSRCTGRRRAVCVGINYTGSRNELQGCVNDAKNVYRFLTEHHHYPPSSILYLTDTASNPRSRPTRKVLINAMKWLVEGAQSDDALFFHYSGHGGQTRDLDGDERDGFDEVIFPLDYKTAGIITDDDMHDIMVKPLPPGCRLTALFDSCHSGSVLDLPYIYHSNGRLKGSDVTSRFKEIKSTPADVITWSGCQDHQTSADTMEGGVAVGAMSYAFIKVLKRNPEISYQDLLQGVRAILNKRYSQKPQLSSSHRIQTTSRFIM